MVQEHVARLRLERAAELVGVERLPRRRPRVLLVDDDGLSIDFQRDNLDVASLLELEAVELLNHGVGDADAGRLRDIGENVEFFSKRRAAAAARIVCVGKRYASGRAAPTRGVSFSNDCAPDTRSASRRPKPARASIVSEGTGHGGPRSSFSEALINR